MTLKLNSENLMGLVTGTETPFDEIKAPVLRYAIRSSQILEFNLVQDQKRRRHLAVWMIYSALEVDVKQTFANARYINDPKLLWDDIKACYEKHASEEETG